MRGACQSESLRGADDSCRSSGIYDDGFFGPTRFAGLHSQYACHRAVHMALAARNRVARH